MACFRLERITSRRLRAEVQFQQVLPHNVGEEPSIVIAPGIEIPVEHLSDVCRRFQIRELSVFGSAARGEMGPDSDIDLLVEFEPEARIGWEFFELEEELTRILGRKVDLGTKRSLKSWIRANV